VSLPDHLNPTAEEVSAVIQQTNPTLFAAAFNQIAAEKAHAYIRENLATPDDETSPVEAETALRADDEARR